MAVKKTVKKRITKNVDKGQVHIHASFNLSPLPTNRVTQSRLAAQARSDSAVREKALPLPLSRLAKRQLSWQKNTDCAAWKFSSKAPAPDANPL